MLFSESVGRKVVSTSTAGTVGRLDDFVVDPSSHSVVALSLKKTDSGDTLPWSSISSFGTDAVTVSGGEVITAADAQIADLHGKNKKLMGGRVLTTLGDEIGKVADVEFDPESGVITALHLGGDQVEGVRLIGIGSWAVVVEAASG